MNDQPDRIRIPADTIPVFPRTINIVYEQVDGEPILGVIYDHQDLGSYVMWLSRSAAEHLADGITGILTNPETFRTAWDKQNRPGA